MSISKEKTIEGHRKKVATCKPRREKASGETKHANNALILDFQALEM